MKVAVFRLQLFKPSETFVAAQALNLPTATATLIGRAKFGPSDPRLASWVPPDLPLPRLAAYLAAGVGDPFVPFLRQWGTDIVHAHFAVDGLYALGAARAIKRPLVTTLHGFDVTTRAADFLRSGRPALMRYAVNQSKLKRQGDLFICVSRFMQEQALAAGFPASRLVQHYIGIDPGDFAVAAHDGPPVVLHVARLVEKKGTRYLIDAFARIASAVPEASLIVVGDGPLLPSLQEQAARLGVAQRVQFAGAQPHAAVRRLMSQSSVLVLPSVTAANGDAEGLGLVLLEAAASGLPVIGTHHGGIPEAVKNGQTGYLVPERNAEAIAGVLESLLNFPSRRLKLGHAGRRMVLDRFNIEQQGGALEQIYNRVRV